MKLYLFGGAPSNNGSSDVVELMRLLQTVIDRLKPNQILHIPYARDVATEVEWEGDWFHRYLDKKGAQYINCEHDSLEHIDNPLILISGGGKSARLLQKLDENPQLVDLIMSAEHIIGESAGAKIFAEFVRTKNKDGKNVLVKGLSVLPSLVIEPHYIENNRSDLLESEMIESGAKYGLGIDSGTGVMIDTEIFPDDYTLLGDGIVEFKSLEDS